MSVVIDRAPGSPALFWERSRQWTQEKDLHLRTGTRVTSLGHSRAVTWAAARSSRPWPFLPWGSGWTCSVLSSPSILSDPRSRLSAPIQTSFAGCAGVRAPVGSGGSVLGPRGCVLSWSQGSFPEETLMASLMIVGADWERKAPRKTPPLHRLGHGASISRMQLLNGK